MPALGSLIGEHEWAGILIVGESGREPDLARIVRGRHLGLSFAWIDPAGNCSLVYFTEMEREEAAATGVQALGPGDLSLTSLRRETRSTGEFVARALVRLLRSHQVKPGVLGLGGSLSAGDVYDLIRVLSDRGWQAASAHKVLQAWRRPKDALEVAEARRVAQATCGAFLKLARRLRDTARPGIRVGDLRRTITGHFADHGLEQPQGNIIAAGAASAVPHTAGDDSDDLRPGSTLVVDLFPRGQVFADCSRTFCLPPIPDEVGAAHSTVKTALQLASENARPGRTVSRAVTEALNCIEEAGYPTLQTDRDTRRGMVHSLGHGVGYQLHELPHLRASTRGEFETGDLITVEPGIYEPEWGWGIRLEDLLLVGEEGAENLTPLPYDLDPAAWPVGE